MERVFISHANEDRLLAQRVVQGLESSGVDCWIAPRDIPPGSDYADALDDAILNSRAVVFLLSAHSAASSSFCRAELEIARTESKTIVPVRLNQTAITKGLRIYLSGRQWLDATDDETQWYESQGVVGFGSTVR